MSNIQSTLLFSMIKPIFSGDGDFQEDEEPPNLNVKEISKKLKKLLNETADAIKTPRPRMVTVNHDALIGEVIEIINQTGFSKIPVIKKDKDNILGVIYAKDILNKFSSNREIRAEELMHEAKFISYSLTVDRVIQFLEKNNTTIAFVIDEFGGVDGMLTMNDISWEIFGKIKDKFDADDEPKIELENNRIVVDGDYYMDDFMELYQAENLDAAGQETLAGFICHSLGKIPESGEVLNLQKFRLTVVDANDKKVNKIAIETISEGERNEK